MTKRERILAAIHGKKTDTLPYSFWSHLPEADLDPVALAEKTYEFYKTYDVDFIKTMNNGMYAIEDFGCRVDYSEIARGGVARLVSTPVNCPKDWDKITCRPIDQGSLARELLSLRLLLEKVRGEDVPVVFTVFSPITTAEKLSGNTLLKHLEEGNGDLVRKGLDAIAETTANLAREALRLGADGIFFATQLSSHSIINEQTYMDYGIPYDLRVLEAAKDGWFNILHIHGDNIMFDLLRDYPVPVLNYHAWETLPALDEAQLLTGKCLMGGLIRSDITNGNKNAVAHQIYQSLKLLGGKKHILTPGCVIRHPLDYEMLSYVKRTKDFIENRMAMTV